MSVPFNAPVDWLITINSYLFVHACHNCIYPFSNLETPSFHQQPQARAIHFAFPLSTKQINNSLYHVSSVNWPFPITLHKPLGTDSDIGV